VGDDNVVALELLAQAIARDGIVLDVLLSREPVSSYFETIFCCQRVKKIPVAENSGFIKMEAFHLGEGVGVETFFSGGGQARTRRMNKVADENRSYCIKHGAKPQYFIIWMSNHE
jgi:hypothetical protein